VDFPRPITQPAVSICISPTFFFFSSPGRAPSFFTFFPPPYASCKSTGDFTLGCSCRYFYLFFLRAALHHDTFWPALSFATLPPSLFSLPYGMLQFSSLTNLLRLRASCWRMRLLGSHFLVNKAAPSLDLALFHFRKKARGSKKFAPPPFIFSPLPDLYSPVLVPAH